MCLAAANNQRQVKLMQPQTPNPPPPTPPDSNNLPPGSQVVYPPSPQPFQPQPTAMIGSDFSGLNAAPASGGRKLPLILCLLFVLIALIGGITIFTLHKADNSTSHIFQTAIINALTTKQVEIRTNLNSGVAGTISTDAKIDASTPANPKVYYQFNATVLGNLKAESYADAANLFIKYSQLASDPIPAENAALNQWAQLRSNGSFVPGYASIIQASSSSSGNPSLSSSNAIPDPREQLFGPLIHGNFSAKDRAALLTFIKTNKVYSYNPKQVSISTMNGSKVYIYNVTFNTSMLVTYNTNLAKFFGISQSDLDRFKVDLGFSSTRTAKLYITSDTKQVVELDSQDFYGDKQVITYSRIDNVILPSTPKADLSFAQIEPILTASIPSQPGNQ